MTEVTRLAAAALAVRDALEQFGAEDVREVETGLFVRISAGAESARTVDRIVADIERRVGISIKIEWGR